MNNVIIKSMNIKKINGGYLRWRLLRSANDMNFEVDGVVCCDVTVPYTSRGAPDLLEFLPTTTHPYIAFRAIGCHTSSEFDGKIQ